MQAGAFAARAFVHRPRDTVRQRGRGLALDHQIHQHLAHGGLVYEAFLKGAAMTRVMDRQSNRLAHHSGRCSRGIEPRQLHHLYNRADTMPFLADQNRMRPVVFDFRRGVRAVAEFVLQPLELKSITGPVQAMEGMRRLIAIAMSS